MLLRELINYIEYYHNRDYDGLLPCDYHLSYCYKIVGTLSCRIIFECIITKHYRRGTRFNPSKETPLFAKEFNPLYFKLSTIPRGVEVHRSEYNSVPLLIKPRNDVFRCENTNSIIVKHLRYDFLHCHLIPLAY